MNLSVLHDLLARFEKWFGAPPAIAAYAPGRVEILGNHTDYNEGFVLSAAINFGTFFAAAESSGPECRLVAGDLMEEVRFPPNAPRPSPRSSWANYVKGVAAKLASGRTLPAFNGMFLGDVPKGAGLSSSAALELSTGLGLCALYRIAVPPIELARIGQAAEHEFAGMKCGLLDQITSLFGRESQLVFTDFRSLEIQPVPFGREASFLVCNTHAKHSLVDSEYNERRARCEAAAGFFKATLQHPVAALRDVSPAEYQAQAARMDPVTARRAAHIVGENDRVWRGRQLLAKGELAAFGALMFESHLSSRDNFENSCPELDAIVRAAQDTPGVLGARLSGGGFGGSAVVLVRAGTAAAAGHRIAGAYAASFARRCEVLEIRPSAGAQSVTLDGRAPAVA